MRKHITKINIRDQGCMLQAYRREIVQLIVNSKESTPFITMLAQYFANNPAEIEVGHEERHGGVSNYNLYKLIRYNFDLVTGFSLVPLQLFTIFGLGLSALSGLLVVVLALRPHLSRPRVRRRIHLLAFCSCSWASPSRGSASSANMSGVSIWKSRQRPRYVVRSVLGEEKQEEAPKLKVTNIK